MKILKFVLLFFVLNVFFFISFFKETHFETNLIRTILPENTQNINDIVSVANKYSSVIKIVFEGGENQKEKFLKEVDYDFFEINKFDISKFIGEYKNYSSNFLSEKDRDLLKNKKYNEVYLNAIEQLYNPVSAGILPFDKDPYFLFSDFLLENNFEKFTEENYAVTELKIKNETGLSPDVINKKISKLVNLQKKYSEKNEKIYLAGTPIHSYYTSRNAVISINIISILSILLILAISYFFFGKTRIIFPVFCSISFGILAGFCAVKLCFQNFQIITMVFSTSLIGLGIDYSYHYFFNEKKDKTFIKNLTLSMFSTIVPFLIFYFTGIELLKQIAVFSISGLIFIYLFVLIFYPYFDLPSTKKQININFDLCKTLLCIISLAAILGFFRLNFNDSLSAFYTPSKNLVIAEKMYNKAIGVENYKTQTVLVRGENLDEILKKEEIISDYLKTKNIPYISISKFFPSEKKQKENFELVKNLYKNNLYKFKEFLSLNKIKELKKQNFTAIKPNKIKEFFLEENTSIMFLFSDEPIIIDVPQVKIINIKTDVEKYLKEYRHKLFKFLPIMIGVLLILLCVFFGKKGIKILLPSLLGMFGAMGLTTLILGELNLFSIISIFLILGFTIDYAIFKCPNKFSRKAEGVSENLRVATLKGEQLNGDDESEASCDTGLNSGENEKNENAIFVSALTTAFSFLLLSFSSFKLLNSIALIIFFGIIISYLFSCIVFRKGN